MGILANSASVSHSSSTADDVKAGYVTNEQVTLSTSPLQAAYAWGISKPSGATSRSNLSDAVSATPVFTPDVAGTYVIIEGTSGFILTLTVTAVSVVSVANAHRFSPVTDTSVPAPALGSTIYHSSTQGGLVAKTPDGTTDTLAILTGSGTEARTLKIAKTVSDAPDMYVAADNVLFNGVENQVLNFGHNNAPTGRVDNTKVGWWEQLEWRFNQTGAGPILSEWFVQWTAADGSPVLRPISTVVNWTTELAEVGLIGKVTFTSTAGTQRCQHEESGRVVLSANSGLSYFFASGHNEPIIAGALQNGNPVELFRVSSNVVANECMWDVNQQLSRMRIHSPGGVYLGLGVASDKAALEVDSTTRGVLFPRMTTTQRDAITSPPDGLMIYNTSNNRFEGRENGVWVDL